MIIAAVRSCNSTVSGLGVYALKQWSDWGIYGVICRDAMFDHPQQQNMNQNDCLFPVYTAHT